MGVEYEILGCLRALADGVEVELGGPRQKALLARLLVGRNELLGRDLLVADLYGGARTGAKALQVGIARVRHALGPDGGLESEGGGYLLRVVPDQLDASRFELALAAGGEDALAAGLALWRGEPLAEFSAAPWAQGEIARLTELRLSALELRAEQALAHGPDGTVIAQLEELVALHPAREHGWSLLMLALYRAGRQADALSAYRDARRHLVEEHGIEPGHELRELQHLILLQDPSLGAITVRRSPGGLSLHQPPAVSGQPFVGRVGERGALQAALARAAAGERVAVLISGEPGIGKSRLSETAVEHARGVGFAVLSGRCDNDLALPFKPFVEALGELPVRLPSQAADMNGQQYSLFAAVAARLLDACNLQPVLLVLEDLHWADRSSLLLLKHLLTTPTLRRLLVLGTYRASELEPEHPLQDLLADLHREAGIMRLELVGLLDAEVAELAAITVGSRAGLAPTAVRELRRSTDGNPFFLTEVLRALLETGREPGEWNPEQPLPLPVSVRETVAARVARLGDHVGGCLSAAAVLGETFDPELVAELVSLPAAEALDAFEHALSAGLLIDEEEQMAFRHSLIAQTMYEALSATRRRRLHRDAAKLLETHASSAPAAIASQWVRARPSPAELDPALRWTRRAGDDAIDKLAPQEAQRWYAEALSMNSRRAPADDDERCELLIELGAAQRQSGDPAFRDTLLEAARIASARGGDARLVRAALANTRGFVSATGGVDEERIAVLEHALTTVGPDPTPVRARLLATLAGELSFTGDWQRRNRLSDEALSLAREAGDPQTLVQVLSQRAVTTWSPATLRDRLLSTAECRHAADLLDDPLAQFQSVHWRASACIESGAFVEAAECRERGRRLAERLRQPTALWMARYDHANEAIVAGRLDQAERLANEAYQLGEASGQPDALLILASQLMVIRYEQGRLGETIELVAQSLEHNPRITGFRSVLALGYCEERRWDEARAILVADAQDRFGALAYDLTWLSVTCVYAHVAARLATVGSMPREVAAMLLELLSPWRDQIAYTGAGGWGLVEHYLGMLSLALGDPERARIDLEEAVRRAERLPAPIWATHSRVELARALLAGRSGDRVSAESLLREAGVSAEAHGCRTLARDAGELLAEATLGPPLPPGARLRPGSLRRC